MKKVEPLYLAGVIRHSKTLELSAETLRLDLHRRRHYSFPRRLMAITPRRKKKGGDVRSG